MTSLTRALALALGLILLTGATAALAKPVPEDQRLPLDLRRTTLVVRDIDRSISLYLDALGMTVSYNDRNRRNRRNRMEEMNNERTDNPVP